MGETTTGERSPETPGRTRRWPLLVAVLLLLTLLAGGGAVAGATVSYADGLHGRLLPGTVIAGVDVGGLTQRDALAAVRTVVAEELDREIAVRGAGQRWTATPRQLGARGDARRVIAEVAASQDGLTWREWAAMRWLGRRADVAAEVTVARQGAAGIRRFAAAVARELNVRPRDADVTVAEGRLQLTTARVGRKVAAQRLGRRLRAAVDTGRERVKVPVRRLKPEVQDRTFRQVLHLDQSDYRLTLFLDGRKHRSWTVATGTGDYPTPLGRYEVSLKRYLPTWVNPDPTGWGADMPASIPPGPGNPLGVRALNWSAPGAIRFHGTQAISSLGRSASHGCVRMANDDVVELYDLVDVGAVILSEA